MSDWICIEAFFISAPDDWSVVAEVFDAHGCPGTLVNDDPPSMSAYLSLVSDAKDRALVLSNALKVIGAASVTLSEVPDTDWSELWKIHFKPREVGDRVVLCPTWDSHTLEPTDRIVILLDPGQAFGTGDHPTTRLCLRLMETHVTQASDVLDLGCGSGVLAIAASKLGAKSVSASDIDPTAVGVTDLNAQLNQVTVEVKLADGFADDRKWDVVVSNIISATLIRLSGEAYSRVANGGKWIVSGIIEANFADVRRSAESFGFRYVEQLEEDGWVGACFTK